MTVKFEKVISQVQTMGRAVAYRSQTLSERGELALQMIEEATDLDEIHRKIEVVRQKDAGYRGAAPYEEPIHQRFLPAPAPDLATIIAVDGSQVYPDQHAAALYYLTNIGTFTFCHGDGSLPREDSVPHLFYKDVDLREKGGHGAVIKNTAVNARRDVQEIQALTEAAWDHREDEVPVTGMRDGRLLWWLSQDVPYAKQLEEEYYSALEGFLNLHRQRQQNASLLGYVDGGDSRFVIRLLHLLDLADEDITRANLETSGVFEGLTDSWLFSRLLHAGERSAVMIQQSPQNKAYKQELGDPFEIAFFYLNVGSYTKPHVVRIEVPMWVVQTENGIAEVQSLILEQAAITGRYPYALTRADEMAVVSAYDKNQLENMINIELLRHQQDVDKSPKQIGKDVARAPRQRYNF